MMGLLIKDFKLLKQQRNMLFIIVAIALVFVLTNNELSIVISYTTFISLFFVTSTISYDEYNKSDLFLLTLPITRKDYAQEKYILGFGVCTSIWILSTLGCTIYQMYMNPQFILVDWFATTVLLLCIPLFTLAFMVPTQLKYGGEKGRIAMIVVVAIAFIIGFGVVMLCQYLNIDLNEILSHISNIGIVVGAVIITIVVNFISYLISVKIMKNKEF